MAKNNRWLLAVCSDTHGGHIQGLLNPATELKYYDEEGNEYFEPVVLNPVQEYLWDLYSSHIDTAYQIAGKDPLVLFHNGDLSHGTRYTQGLIYSSIANQILIAYANINAWLEHPKAKKLRAMRMFWGTDCHIMGEGTTPRLVENMLLGNYDKLDLKSYPHGKINIGGIEVDAAHHGPSGGFRSWLIGNSFRYYLKSIMFDELKHGALPPHLVLRGHYHIQVEEHIVEFFQDVKRHIIGLILPSYALPNEWVRLRTKSVARVTNGMALIDIVNGEVVKVHWLTQTRDNLIRETIR